MGEAGGGRWGEGEPPLTLESGRLSRVTEIQKQGNARTMLG